jgi:hypothetical protein
MPPTKARVDRNLAVIGQFPVRFILTWMLVVGFPLVAAAHDPDASDPGPSFTHEEDTNLAEVGAKLSNPVSDVWALFTQFGLTWSDGATMGAIRNSAAT